VSSSEDKTWQAAVAPYLGADAARSIFQLISTLVLLSGGFVITYWGSTRSVLLTSVGVLITSGLVIRSFTLMHDCAHGSFLPWRRVNDVVGVMTGLIAFTPYAQWRRDHAIHHASSGDLDRRGHGDVTTWTVREYLSKTPRERLMYRLSRHPILLLLGGPAYLLYTQRFPTKTKSRGDRQAFAVWATNAGLLAISVAIVSLWGWRGFAVWIGTYYLAAIWGVWLFYVQHQFEDAYWEEHEEWDYETSAMKGSSHLRLPKILQWFTGSIGLHHVHHLAPRIPNYRLQRCHDDNPRFHSAPVITIPSGVAALRLALWDEERRRLVRFDEVRKAS
jgi:omega-6 fatty acid desaturase (delta-12 desaturase)